MLPLPAHRSGSRRSPGSLATYYRQCLEREQMQRLQLSLPALRQSS
ncbi:MAG TPA: hypothetical protein VGK74_19635 [Symbiobacteriaceae bacterium]